MILWVRNSGMAGRAHDVCSMKSEASAWGDSEWLGTATVGRRLGMS